VTGLGGSSSNANSALGFSLASLPSVTDEQLETLGDDDLCLLINKLQRVYHNKEEEEEPRVLPLRRSKPLHRRLPQEVRRWPKQQPRLLPPPRSRRGRLQQ